MKMKSSGWKLEAPKFKDYSHELAFGASNPEPIVPLGRSVAGVPLVYQGEKPGCVSCSVTWIKEWMESVGGSSPLCWEFLYNESLTGPNGVAPTKVLDIARKTGIPVDQNGTDADRHRIPGYFFLRGLDSQSVYAALKQSPIMVGVADWNGAGPHMMVAYDVQDEETLEGVGWWDPKRQELVKIPFGKVIFACRIAPVPEGADGNLFRLPFIDTLSAKIAFFIKRIVC